MRTLTDKSSINEAVLAYCREHTVYEGFYDDVIGFYSNDDTLNYRDEGRTKEELLEELSNETKDMSDEAIDKVKEFIRFLKWYDSAVI